MEPPIDELLQEYQRQLVANPETAYRSLLEQSKRLLLQQLNVPVWQFQTIQAGVDVYHWLGDKTAIVDLLTNYLTQPLAAADELWARWHLSDNLAMLRRCAETVQCQKQFLDRARQVLSQVDDWMLWPDWPWSAYFARRAQPTPASDCLLIRVMYDGTQALCWLKEDKADEWLTIYHEVMSQTLCVPTNRVDRRYYIRTAAWLMIEAQRGEEALQLGENLDHLSKEDSAWDEAFETKVDAMTIALEARRLLGDIRELRHIGSTITQVIDEQIAERNLTEQVVRTLCHNTAWSLYRAKQYDLAIPLFERAVQMNIPSEYAYLWLAASIWATTKDRARTLKLLKQAADRRRGNWQPFQKLPEFQDVREDKDFLAIFDFNQQDV